MRMIKGVAPAVVGLLLFAAGPAIASDEIAQGVADSAGSSDGVVRDTTNLNIENTPNTARDGLVPKVVSGLGLSG
ncbi:hypothetical protein AB0L39_33485 [Streptomyces parvus]|uniref:hypothetical protein n=1 Tax=Streptomyces parvus TaxID=66428 RepID=UPI003414F2C8